MENSGHKTFYRELAKEFRLFLDQNTVYSSIKFGGAFAQTDYLLKECDASPLLRHAVNSMRIRLRRFSNGQLTEKEMKECAAMDRETMIRFTEAAERRGETGSGTKKRETGAEENERSTVSRQADHTAKPQTNRPLPTALRFIVDRWTESAIIGKTDCLTANGSDEEEAEDVGYEEETTVSLAHYYNNDKSLSWEYLKAMLYPSAQLCLVKPRMKDGVVIPELIIFEPDYLVDVSAVAACFETYATSATVHLLNKLKPSETTEHTLMGNFASQLLDETVTNREPTTYQESAMRFFRRNAFSMLTAQPSAEFHRNAMRQKQNIQTAFKELTESGGFSRFNMDDVLLEPSFISPMLGLQGRMDLLQMDFRFLMEQKAGKAAFPEPAHPGERPLQQTKHYVQMLLYMLIARYGFNRQYEANNRNLFAFLLYSKYDASLCALSFAPQLVFHAIRVRNEIVRAEYGFAKDGFDMLTQLTPETLNEHRIKGKLWLLYIKPQLESLLSPIDKASELERAYYLRFLKFISTEHLLSKIGNHRKECSGFASTWLSTQDEKQQAGCICTLETVIRNGNLHNRESADSLYLQNRESAGGNSFRKGDAVILYPYSKDSTPDATQAILQRGTIEDISPDGISLRLRNRQADDRAERYFRDCNWAIEHDFIESSYTSLYRAMHAFLKAPQRRKDLILLKRRPDIDTSRKPNGDYGSFNELQRRIKQAQDMFLIIGPPGTGKTSFGMLYTLREQLTEGSSNVLVLSYTNRAVDEICSKLVEDGIDFIRIGNELNTEKEYHSYLMENRVAECANLEAVRRMVESCRVFVGTATALNVNQQIFALKSFGLAIIDEASQILEPHIIGLLSALHGTEAAIKKFVMIGDHKQLPAVVQQNSQDSTVNDTALREVAGLTDCRLSLFERLLSRYADNPAVTFMLTRQGRMHRDIADFPSRAFYNSRLCVVPLPHQEVEQGQRIDFHDTAPDNSQTSDKVNLAEAKRIAELAVQIYNETGKEAFSPTETIGVIVPYRNQTTAVRREIDKYGIPELHDITIDTVERYQGSQREHIIYGFTVKKAYQLQFLTENTFTDKDGTVVDRKLNVVMTRARQHLHIFGNAALVQTVPLFAKLIDYLKQRNAFYEDSEKC